MGDRANIVVKSDGEQVCFYTHWGGADLPRDLQRALARKERWNDFQYLTRIIFCSMIPDGYWKESTGHGITQNPWDGDDRVIEVDVDAQTVKLPKLPVKSFQEFIEYQHGWGD